MKLVEHFNSFLSDHVNLNQSRVDLLSGSVDAVKSAIKIGSWEAKVISFAAQGSWAHQTIIKPLPGKEFDADLLVFVEAVDGWEAKDYINKLHAALNANSTYSGKLRRYSHCVTIEYAGERRIDVAPCLQDRQYLGQYEVCNRGANEFVLSAPVAYTEWVNDKNSVASGNNLRKVTRLLKYLRDIKGTFTCPSFLFTTLLGYRIQEWDKATSAFADLPTSLKTLIDRLDDWLQANSTRPEVRNPVLASEVQSDGWDTVQYSNFRDRINLYRGWIDDAYDEPDRDESIGKWQRVLGDNFAASEAKQTAALLSDSVTNSPGALTVLSGFRDLVDMVKKVGKQAIPTRIFRLPHIQRPKWRWAPSSQHLTVKVSAYLTDGEYGVRIKPVESLTPLRSGRWLCFVAANTSGLPFPHAYRIMWRVTNTDRQAADAGQLRGDFYNGKSDGSRAESLQFRGVHFVEAFLVRKRDGMLMGKSEPFFVVVE